MQNPLIEKLDACRKEALAQISGADAPEALNGLKVAYLGRKGSLTEILKTLGSLAGEDKASVGRRANEVKTAVLAAIASREAALKANEVVGSLASDAVDVTVPGVWPLAGTRHPVTKTLDDMRGIFARMGFDICDGPEIEDDRHNFEALAIPADHPARAMQDTFYFPDGTLLRTHTSPVQIRVMEERSPPIAMVAPGVVYRRDSDVTHSPMFHQLEALLVDEGIHFGHLKAVVNEFLSALFDAKANLRFRPSYFPFTEPSAEVDMACVFCGGKGCRVCKLSGWLEIMGCGMVDPEVFRQVGIDYARYSGFAFGIGVERVAMLKHGIADIRLFFENDLRFLRQF